MDYQYDQSKNVYRTPPRKNPKGSDTKMWVLIAVLFCIGLWPVAMILMIVKLTDRKKTSRAKTYTGSATYGGAQQTGSRARQSVENMTRTPADSTKSARNMKVAGTIMTVLGCVVAMSVLSDLRFYVMFAGFWMFVEDIFPALGFLGGGIVLLLFGRSMTNRMRRFSKYLAVAGDRPWVEIRRLADAAEVKTSRVESDLESMIDKGLWGESAYLDLGAGKLYRSAQAAREEEQARQEKKAKTETPPEAEEGYAGMLRQIRRVNDRILDESLSAKIDRLEELTGRIFRLVEKESEKKAAASTFLNYYLPTTQKLLNSYAEFEEAGVSGKNLNEAKARIERIMDTIVQGFERQLDELYRVDTMDIESDIRVMEAMLRRDGATVENDFGLGSDE